MMMSASLLRTSMAAPRWYYVFRDTIFAEDNNPTYTLSTVASGPSGSYPRSRSVIHRGMVSPSPSRPLLLTTTDIRTPKAHQLHANPNSEATFWFSRPNVQFRIVASTFLLPHPSHPWHSSFPKKDLAGDENVNVNWENTRLEAFDGLSGHLRASFVRPVPGTPMNSYEEAKEWPETLPKQTQAKGTDKNVLDEALSNFALVVLDPAEVEFLELSPIPNRRTKWVKNGIRWDEQILVP